MLQIRLARSRRRRDRRRKRADNTAARNLYRHESSATRAWPDHRDPLELILNTAADLRKVTKSTTRFTMYIYWVSVTLYAVITL